MRQIFLLLFVLALGLLCLRPAQARELIAEGAGTLAIDEAGLVEAVTLESQHGEAIDKAVEGKMARWRFEPVLVGGKPAKVLAHMRFLLRARPVEGSESLTVSIADVDFVDPPAGAEAARKMARDIQPPAYPREMISRRLGARVELAVELDVDGQVLRSAPLQSWLVGRPVAEKQRRKYMAQFVEASSRAVATWRFDPPAPGEALVYVPLSFMIAEGAAASDLSRWRPAAAVEFPAEPWMLRRVGEGVALAADGSRLRQDLKLITPVDS